MYDAKKENHKMKQMNVSIMKFIHSTVSNNTVKKGKKPGEKNPLKMNDRI